MTLNMNTDLSEEFKVGEERIEEVEEFVYLGSLLSKRGVRLEIQRRIKSAL